MVAVNAANPDWVTIATYDNTPGCPQPMAAVRA